MKRSGSADLPLHYGAVPLWLSERMSKLGLAIVEAIATEFGTAEVVRKISDPFWFQSFGAVMGMDWHSSGITTSVMGALKRAVNPVSSELGIYICGGKGKQSVKTPAELLAVGDRTGVDGIALARTSRLTAKVDNNAIQDGFQLYLHSFIVTDKGDWAVIQQGMNADSRMARRYHWHSENLQSFVNEPHSFIYGVPQGNILNLTDSRSANLRDATLDICRMNPDKIIAEARHLKMPDRHDLQISDVNLKRLGAMLWVAHDQQPGGFEDLLLLEGLGPRTLQSLALVSEVIYGTPGRFDDPARFSFAHGGKDGHPFPVPVKVFDQTINVLRKAVDNAKIGNSEKADAIKKLHEVARNAETGFIPNQNFHEVVARERRDSHKYGGRTVFGKAKPPEDNGQLKLF